MTALFRTSSPVHIMAAQAAGVEADAMFRAVEHLAAPRGGPVDVEAGYAMVTAYRHEP